MEENIEFAADTIIAEPVEPQGPSRGEMRRVFSRIGLGLCLGLLVSQLVPSLLTVIFPTFDAQAHASSWAVSARGASPCRCSFCWAGSSPPDSRRETPSARAGSWLWCASATPA